MHMEIRKSLQADEAEIADITREAFELAFGSSPEVGLLEQLRATETGMLELVTEHEGRVVGHIAATKARQSPVGPQRFYCLGPMAVRPDMQHQGIGQSLVTKLLDELWELGVTAVVLIGHPGFYAKCGFEEAGGRGFTTDFEAPSEAFMVATNPDLSAIDPIRITYAKPFYEL